MTLLVASITETGAMVSQDSWIYSPGDRAEYEKFGAGVAIVNQTMDEAASGRYVGGGGGPASVTIHGSACKLMPLPQIDTIVAVTGGWSFLLAWLGTLAVMQARSIADLNERTPEHLRLLQAELQQRLGTREDAIIIHAGLDRQAGRGYGFSYSSGDGFKSVPIAPGTTLMPAVESDDAFYNEIAELSGFAIKGERLERFHNVIYRQQHSAFMEGRLGPNIAIGGGLFHATVGAGGIRFSTAGKR